MVICEKWKKELRDYFSELIQPLATNECLQQIFQKLKEDIVTKFEEKFIEQNKKNWWARRTSFISRKYHQLALN